MSRKFALVLAALALAFSVSTVSAATIAELQAMIAQLQAQLAALSSGAGAGASYTYTRDLTVGSTGADVTALQQSLVAKGHLTMPAGVAYGYFGNLTRAAVSAWQAANGISPTAGYVGPKSRAALNATAGVPAPAAGTPAAGITTIGKEGTLTVELNPSPGTGLTLREGTTRQAFLGIKVKAQLSDLSVQRVKLQLSLSTDTNGETADFYNKVFPTVYLLDGSNVLASSALNASTVVKESTSYFITLTGFNFVVPKDTSKVLTVAFDLNSSVDSNFDADTFSIQVPANGVRAVDGAGINQESPTTAFSRSQTIEATSQAEDATLQISLNSASPKAAEIVASQGSAENELDGVHIASVDLRAEKDAVMITDWNVEVTQANTANADPTTVWLYDSANPSVAIGSASVADTTVGSARFSDIDFTIPKDTTKTLLVKIDVRNANTTAETMNFAATSTGVVAENSEGTVLAAAKRTGSATGETFTARSVGPIFTLLSRSIVKSSTPPQAASSTDSSLGSVATSTAEATFSLKVKAVGGDILFGNNASTTYPMISNGTGAPAKSFIVYLGGASTNLAVSSSTSYAQPSSGVTSSGSNSFSLAENSEVTIPVTHLIEARVAATGALVTTGSYAIGLERINWVSAGTQANSTFMSGNLDWRSSTVAMP